MPDRCLAVTGSVVEPHLADLASHLLPFLGADQYLHRGTRVEAHLEATPLSSAYRARAACCCIMKSSASGHLCKLDQRVRLPGF
jgi:hypothetical protein